MNATQSFAEISSRSAAELAEKYLAVRNEPDADERRRTITELWAEDGRHIRQPPEEPARCSPSGSASSSSPRAGGSRAITRSSSLGR